MTARERLFAAIQGKPVDHPPFTAWHHFHLKPPAGPNSGMSDAEIDFFNRLRPDLLKVMHDVEYEPVDPIENPQDWKKLRQLDPREGNFGAQLYTLRQIRGRLHIDVPMIDTVFNPFHYGNKISHGKLLEHLRVDPESVHQGLNALCESLGAYAVATIGLGCEGVYYALEGASADGATHEEYEEHFLPYDRRILDRLTSTPATVLHIHGYRDLYFDLVHDLPAAAVCWSDRAANGPTLAEARGVHNRCLMGGLDEKKAECMSAAEIAAQAVDAYNQVGRSLFILAPGCSLPDKTPQRVLDDIRRAAFALT